MAFYVFGQPAFAEGSGDSGVIPPVVPPVPTGGTSTFVSPFTGDQLLDLVPGVGQVGYTIDFEIWSKTGVFQGVINPMSSRNPTVEASTDRAIKRTCNGLRFSDSDFRQIDPISDRLQVWFRLQTNDRWPIGRFMFGELTKIPRTSGDERASTLFDQTVILDQPVGQSVVLRRGQTVDSLYLALAYEVGITHVHIFSEAGLSTVAQPISWPTGTSRYKIMSDLAKMIGCHEPYFDGIGNLICREISDLATRRVDHHYLSGTRIIDGSITETDDSFSAPNRYIISGGNAEAEVSAYYDIPSDAPHSVANRGFVVAEFESLSGVETSADAYRAAYAAYAGDIHSYGLAEWDSSPDPRHELYDIVDFRDQKYLEAGWTLDLTGAKMKHRASRIWGTAA